MLKRGILPVEWIGKKTLNMVLLFPIGQKGRSDQIDADVCFEIMRSLRLWL